MNYRHAYHAGNFADVLKHAILARVISHLTLKPTPFRIIDTHAGSGRYDLKSVEAGKTGEWTGGIGRLMGASPPPSTALILEPYLQAVRDLNRDGALKFYPGSPLLARMLMRRDDQLVANELHAEDYDALKTVFHKVRDTKVLNLDAWTAIKSLLPPKERRGAVLIDPPFEQTDEFERLADAMEHALVRFATGTFVIWYPLKNERAADRFISRMQVAGTTKALDARLWTAAPGALPGLTATGILVVNPPFRLRQDLEVLLPFLVAILAEGAGATHRLSGWRDGWPSGG